MEAALFFWLAGIADNISSILTDLGLIITVGGFFWCYACVTNKVSVDYDWSLDAEYKRIYHARPDTKAIEFQAMWKTKIPQATFIIGVCMLTIGLLIPSKQTIYLMAGGYLGQNVIMSDTASKMKTIIDSYLDEQIANLSK